MNNSACPEVLQEVAALPAASLACLAAARDAGEYSQFAAELSPETLRHLPDCDFCRAEIALLAGATATLGALPAPVLPPDFAARISNAIADLPQDAIVSPEIAASETPGEYSHTSAESVTPDAAPAMIAPPLPRAAKRNWRARFGLKKIGGAPRRNLKIAWASGSVLAAFVLVLATQIEPPSMLAPHSNSATSASAPSPASTREETSETPGVQKDAAQLSAKAPSKTNAPPNKTEPLRPVGAAPNVAPTPLRDAVPSQNVPRGKLVEPPVAPITKSGGSAPRGNFAPPSLPLQRAAPEPESALKIAAPPKPRDETRKAPPSHAATTREPNAANNAAARVLAPPAPLAQSPSRAEQKPNADRERLASGALRSRPVPAGAAPQRDGASVRTSATRENFAPPAAIAGGAKNSEAAAPPSVASPRDAARSTPKMRGDSAEESREAAAPNDSADASASASSKANVRSGAFAAPAPAVRNRVAKTLISLHVELAAPRDIERARLRLELPRGAKLQTETHGNIIWSGALKSGENVVADVKIIADETASSHRARAVLESRERDGWRIVATKNVDLKAP